MVPHRNVQDPGHFSAHSVLNRHTADFAGVPHAMVVPSTTHGLGGTPR
ncbi:hypothetical protein EDD27_0143 [Nonomuraea polychroma]|uniref:Uncharacterized protein n=1 Tax=Nonomuraea polychroma TaxID=46176 RepID=A0A438LWG8_9ACTN|nr:hypothetical protein EDD27_0143 [Nonomuraea polychroma]